MNQDLKESTKQSIDMNQSLTRKLKRTSLKTHTKDLKVKRLKNAQVLVAKNTINWGLTF